MISTIFPSTAGSSPSDPALLPDIWRASELARVPTVSSGHLELDQELPNKGWPRSSLVELLLQQFGIGELKLLKPILKKLSRSRRIALIQPPDIPHAKALQGWGIEVDRLLWMRASSTGDALWTAEQILKNGSCGAVVLWQTNVRAESLRRLHLAAQAADTHFWLLRPMAGRSDSQPMGFYSPSQLVQDARRHGVVVLGVDVMVSAWEAVLETAQPGVRAVRLGFNTIRGMQREAAWRIEEARAASPFASVHDLGVRAALDEELLKLLAAADALAALTGNRRQAMWVAAGSAPDRGLLREAAIAEHELELAAPTDSENTLADYQNLGLTLGRHPLSYLRERLHAMRLMTADVLHHYDDARLAIKCPGQTTWADAR